MLKVRFTGRVLPTATNVTISNHPTVHWKDQDGGASFTIDICNGAVRIDCEVEHFSPEDVPELYRRAIDIARASVDLIAFSLGAGLTVVLDEFTDPRGHTTQVLPRDPALPPLCTAYRPDNPDFDKVLRIAISEPALFFALRDLIESITLPHRAPINCARAVETIRVLIAPGVAEREDQWATLQQRLNLGEHYLRFLTDHAIPYRHGDYSFLDGATTREITRRAWIIMDRFLVYRKGQNQPLALSDFPLL